MIAEHQKELARLKAMQTDLFARAVRLGEDILSLERRMAGAEAVGRPRTLADRVELVLRAKGHPLNLETIRGLLNQGQPRNKRAVSYNTLYVTMNREPARFQRLEKGLYQLRAWEGRND